MTVDESYNFCRAVARTQARNFYYSFVLLSKPQRNAMCAIYAFMRHCDDLSDGPEAADGSAMAAWRRDLEGALAGRFGQHACWPAFHDAVQRYRIPHEYFHHMIDGVASDLQPRDITTWDELYRYCYQVASVVGLTITHIFGYESPRALELAEKCGVAFQLTNIIRDVKEDTELGRCYLPREDRERFPELRDLLRFQAERAWHLYRESEPLIGLVHPQSRRSLWALMQLYQRLLRRIEQEDFQVMNGRIRLPAYEKAGIVMQALFRPVG